MASVAFGFAHIFHAPFPNWKYVFLATVAGLFYGRTWIKTGSLFPGAIVHALVDILWHILIPLEPRRKHANRTRDAPVDEQTTSQLPCSGLEAEA